MSTSTSLRAPNSIGGEPPAALQTEAQYVYQLLKRALIFQLLGLLALVSAACFLGVGLMLPFSCMVAAIRLVATSVHVANPFSRGYLMTLLQLFATYTALRARDNVLFLVEHIRRE